MLLNAQARFECAHFKREFQRECEFFRLAEELRGIAPMFIYESACFLDVHALENISGGQRSYERLSVRITGCVWAHRGRLVGRFILWGSLYVFSTPFLWELSKIRMYSIDLSFPLACRKCSSILFSQQKNRWYWSAGFRWEGKCWSFRGEMLLATEGGNSLMHTNTPDQCILQNTQGDTRIHTHTHTHTQYVTCDPPKIRSIINKITLSKK